MAGRYSFITFHTGERKTIDRAKGNQMLKILHGLAEPDNDKQADYLLNVKSIYPSLDAQTSPTSDVKPVDDYWATLEAEKQQKAAAMAGEHLTHVGRLQGRSQQIPAGDQ